MIYKNINACIKYSFCLVTLFLAKLSPDFSRNRKYFVVRQAFAIFQHGFLSFEENVDLQNLINIVWENVNQSVEQTC